MASVDPARVTQIIREIAQQVILPRFRALASRDVREKNPGDLVTIADTEAELHLGRRLSALLPDSLLVGEESVSEDVSLLRALEGQAPVWVIDPIDGTGNFVRGDVHFAVVVALVVEKTTLQGWIHDPMRDRTFLAVRDQGAWCDGRRLRLEPRSGVAGNGMIGAAAWRDRPRLEQAGHRLRQMGSAAHEYLALLEGSLDFSCYHRLHPWDHAAGVLMHREAGGVSGLVQGGDYVPLPQEGTLLMAPDSARWQVLRGLFL
jgi:fructose-1,6-bisphosphatase/inositol monophosphatase family enzyme